MRPESPHWEALERRPEGGKGGKRQDIFMGKDRRVREHMKMASSESMEGLEVIGKRSEGEIKAGSVTLNYIRVLLKGV